VSDVKQQTKVVRVRATAPGFSGGRRRVGDEFDVRVKVDAKGKPVTGSWFVLAPEADAERDPKAADDRQTLAQGGKQTGADLV
jgi:hypothetical protein